MLASNPATLKIDIESPPLVCYGPPKDSTGALLSGQIRLDVHEPELPIRTLEMVLMAEVFTRRAVSANCLKCNTRTEEVHKWDIVTQSVTLQQGVHSYPFSYLIPGNLPASNSNALGRIKYMLYAKAISNEGDEIKLVHELVISRAIISMQDRHSVRIFPPTNLSAHVQLPPVVHLGGDCPLSIRLDGVNCPEKETRWRLRKVSWRIEEHSQVISPACPHHPSRLCIDGKGILHEDSRTISSGELKTGWKTDYGPNGRIEMEVMAGIPAGIDAACDVDSPSGVKVSHVLVMEMIVAEEHVPTGPHRLVTATGAARVLRMQLQLCVTARAGLGISWDEEQPPMYGNIPAPPPQYATAVVSAPKTITETEAPPAYTHDMHLST